ncbi:MAG TPA: NADH-quinone oxidoreductase subunit N, partial [Gaiellaceae bacterium]|nr:NADH-quinone oxidoreductase subunit N [Gaiellaceae bacterium]
MIDTPSVDWLALSPTAALLAASGLALVAAVVVPEWMRKAVAAAVAFAGFVTAAVLAGVVFDETPTPEVLLSGSMARDQLAALAGVILAVTGAVVVLVSWTERRRDNHGEYYSLLAAAGAGMVFFVSAEDLMTLFLGLEWFSLCLYILVALDTERAASLEAGLKYLVVGGFGSAVLLLGSAFVYGATGQISFEEIATADPTDDVFLLAGLAMILAGLAFKVSAAPFHMWTPDVYQGAPTSVTAFMSAATKTAALVVLLRVLVTAFPDQSDVWTIAVAVLACISLAWGNLAALAQRDVKRLLAYSSISHAGFMLMAISADSARGGEALLYYLVPYSAMS